MRDGESGDTGIIRKASATVVAGFAVLAASPVLAIGPVGPFVDEGLRETADTLLGTVPAVPTSETNTPQARLGRALFWDVRLSANGQVACASCHTRENWGSDDRPKSTDARDRPTEHPFHSVFHSMDASGLRLFSDNHRDRHRQASWPVAPGVGRA